MKTISPASKKRRISRVLALIRIGGKCAQCGEADMRCLEIDHIEPLRATRAKRSTATAVVNEILDMPDPQSKYQALCGSCHNIKTWRESDPDYFPRQDDIEAEIQSLSKYKQTVIAKSPLSEDYWSAGENISEAAVALLRLRAGRKWDRRESRYRQRTPPELPPEQLWVESDDWTRTSTARVFRSYRGGVKWFRADLVMKVVRAIREALDEDDALSRSARGSRFKLAIEPFEVSE